MTKTFKKGDIVIYSRNFLQSISWYTDVPINGKIVDDSDPEYPGVHWCDRDDPIRVFHKNLILSNERHLEPV